MIILFSATRTSVVFVTIDLYLQSTFTLETES